MNRVIFHVDVNSAFLSWEAARRVALGEDDLRLIPSVIGGDPQNRTSIVLAKSIPAKKYGIVTGEPMSAALRKCPGLVTAAADFALYGKMSREFKKICRDFSPVVEEFSIDECFLDMSGMQRIYPDPVKAAHVLKDRIRSELGFTVNVGISSNKLLAKMASDFQKPDRVHTLFRDEVPEKMWPLPVGELFLCGKASAEKLKRIHIDTIGELAKCDVKSVQALLGSKPGMQLWQYANGMSDSPVNGTPQAAKGYSNEITFEDNITDIERGDNVLLHLADNVAARLRKDNVKGRCVSVTIRGNDMRKRSHQKKLDFASDSTSFIYGTAKALYRELWDRRMPLRLMGLSVTDLNDDTEERQLSFFDVNNSVHNSDSEEKNREVDKAVDSLRERFGNDIIKRGGMVNSGIRVRKR